MRSRKEWRLTYAGLQVFGAGVAMVVRFDGHWAGFVLMSLGAYLLAEVVEALAAARVKG